MWILVSTDDYWFGAYKVTLLVNTTIPGNILRYEHSPYHIIRTQHFDTRQQLLDEVVSRVVHDHWFAFSRHFNSEWFQWILENHEEYARGLMN